MDESGHDLAGRALDPWRPSTPEIDVGTFREVLDEYPIVVIHVWAAWDWHDREMDRILGEVRPDFEEWIEFRSFDVDSDREGLVTRSLGMKNVPAVACYIFGERVETLVGVRTAREWLARFEGWLQGIASRPILYGSKVMFSG